MPKNVLFLSFLLVSFSTQAAGAEVCATASNLVQNCGFESGDFTNWSVVGDTANTGVDAFDARTGAYGAYLAGFGSFAAGDQKFSKIEQNLSTVAGQSYAVWYYSAHFTNADVTPDNVFAAAVNGSTIANSLQLNVGTAPYARSTTYQFVASAPVTSLMFLAEDANFVFSLDDVSVVATPEPASFLLIAAAGFIGSIAFLLRGRRNERQGALEVPTVLRLS